MADKKQGVLVYGPLGEHTMFNNQRSDLYPEANSWLFLGDIGSLEVYSHGRAIATYPPGGWLGVRYYDVLDKPEKA